MVHRHNEAPEVGTEQLDKAGFTVGALDFDIPALKLTEQSLDPAHKLALELIAVYDQKDGSFAEDILALENEAGRGDHGEGFAGTLRMPNEAGLFGVVGAAVNDLDWLRAGPTVRNSRKSSSKSLSPKSSASSSRANSSPIP